MLVSSTDFARALRAGARTIRSWCAEGRVPAVRFGKLWRIDLARLEHQRPELHAAWKAGRVALDETGAVIAVDGKPLAEPRSMAPDFDGQCGEG